MSKTKEEEMINNTFGLNNAQTQQQLASSILGPEFQMFSKFMQGNGINFQDVFQQLGMQSYDNAPPINQNNVTGANANVTPGYAFEQAVPAQNKEMPSFNPGSGGGRFA